MKKKTVQKMLSVILAAGLLLTGCGGKTDAGAEQKSDPEQASAGTEANEAEGEETGGEKTWSEDEIITLKLFCDEVWWPYDEWSGRIPDIVTEKFGIKFEVTVPSDVNQLNMMIASGDLGDLVCSGKFTRLSDSNICYSLDELAQEYNTDLNIHSVMRFVNTADDGKLYTQMVGYSPNSVLEGWDKVVYEQAGMVIRTDIYEELGSPALNNLDDFTNLLQSVKENYPDIVPFAYNYSFTNDYIKILCGATPDEEGFVDVDGKAVPFIMDPGLERYYELMNDWYRKGYMTDENFAWTGTEDEELMISGKLFADSFYSNSEDLTNPKLEQAGADFRVQLVVDMTRGQEGAHWTQGTAGWRGLFIPRSCKDPERVLEFCKWAWSDEGQELLLWGEEGVDWNWDEDHSYPILNYDFEAPNAEDGVKYWGWMCHDGKANVLPGYGNGGSTYDARVALTEICDANPVMGMLRMGADSNEQVIMDNLKDLYMNESTNIITAKSAEECKEKYEAMLEAARNMGADQLTEWANEKYGTLKAEYDKIKDNKE
ncbi:extracellular solute-binding protein [Parablautia intestinalis]|jgi:putative aldouronate transport system substrate-binding protein|uniref:Extracellular solute-binding protein n=1 Tax=Parablautia intestinalis TaxID=2320100 RepID=A0A3A9AYU5_9FIRM|nr:extracellular solute-binding protein [Parablautia intestinalis]MCI8613608.1 extracellular solute-binding protein [Lachnospiraceae bacterium]RKI91555.1 extracellular solute-binding protein [Parablautia intestinalis]